MVVTVYYGVWLQWSFLCFFFQAEDGIRDLVRSRGLGDVYKRQGDTLIVWKLDRLGRDLRHLINTVHDLTARSVGLKLSLIHI